MTTTPPTQPQQPSTFEWWMVSNLGFGFAFNSFLPVLLPAYILSVGGTPTDVGVAMAMAGLFALAGPGIGSFAVRYRAYRPIQALGILGLSGCFALLAISEGDSFVIVLAMAVMGIGAAALLVVSPTFIVGAGLPREVQAKQLTTLQLNLDAGKIAGGVVLGIMAGLSLSADNQFWAGAGILAALAVFVYATNGRAVARLLRATDAARAEERKGNTEAGTSIKSMIFSLFGLLLLAQVLATMTGQVVSSQYSNIFTNVFSLSEEQISAMVAVSGFFGIALYFVAGAWMARADSTLVWATGNALRGAGGLTLAVFGAVGGMPFLAILGAYLLFESTAAFSRVAQSPTAVNFAPGAAAVATGWFAASQALGQAGAALGAGVLAEAVGDFEVLLWAAGALGVASAAIGFLVLVPAARGRGASP